MVVVIVFSPLPCLLWSVFVLTQKGVGSLFERVSCNRSKQGVCDIFDLCLLVEMNSS